MFFSILKNTADYQQLSERHKNKDKVISIIEKWL